MNIEIKKSQKPVKYEDALSFMEKRLIEIDKNKSNDLIWILEHNEIYTAGKAYKEDEIIDKSIIIFKTNRGGKITYHGPGQLVFYFVIDLNKRGKNIKKIITAIEKTIINTLKNYDIKCFADQKNIGIWFEHKSGKIDKIAAIGIKVKKWIAYHGFALNISNDLNVYNKIVPCGIRDRGVSNLIKIKKQNYKNIENDLIKNFLSNIKN